MSSSVAVYPWQTSQWQRLKKAQANNRLPHALILYGAKGLGKHHFAQGFVQSLYCQELNDAGLPCGHCQACHQYSIGTLPDVLQIMPEEKGKQIPIDTIRKMSGYLALSSVENQHRCVIIHDAENMNTASMNAVLKTLEEPPGNALIILVTAELHRLTMTIKSRCQKISFNPPDNDTARQWLMTQEGITQKSPLIAALSMAQNAPLKALEIIENKQLENHAEFLKNMLLMLKGELLSIELSGQYEKQNMDVPLYFFLLDLLKYKAGVSGSNGRSEEGDILGTIESIEALQPGIKKIPLSCLLNCMNKILAYRRDSATVALNYRLFLEDVFIELTKKIY